MRWDLLVNWLFSVQGTAQLWLQLCQLRVVRVSVLPVVYVAGSPCSVPFLSKLNNFPITFEDVRIGRVLRRVLKTAEAPLLSFVAIAWSNSE